MHVRRTAMKSIQEKGPVYLSVNRFGCVLGVALFCLSGGVHLLGASKGKPALENKSKVTEQEPEYNLGADAQRKAAMSPEERAWEIVLEQNLGSFYLPGYKREKSAGRETAWDYVKDDPALPRVLIIGDSISRGYTLPVRHALKGKVNLHRAPENCGPTANGLKKLDIWLGDPSNRWDVITFNFGIHDRKTPDVVYVKNLKTIITKLQATGAKLIWVNTTPVPKGANEYVKDHSERANTLAASIMTEEKIPIVDLYNKAKELPAEDKIHNNCHFRDGGYEMLGAAVATEILAALEKEPRSPNK